MVLDIQKINNFLDKLKPFSQMWNSLHIASISYKRKADKEWSCFFLVLHVSERDLEPKVEVKYSIPERLIVLYHAEKFSLEELRKIMSDVASGSFNSGKFNLTLTGFRTIDIIKESRPGWQREGLLDTEGWPALILRNYEVDRILNQVDLDEIEDLLKRHKPEPHNSLLEVTSKYLGAGIGGGSGAVYCVAPIYLKIEEARFDERGNLAVTIAGHRSMKPSDLGMNVVLKEPIGETESTGLSLTEIPETIGNFWKIKKTITPSKISFVEATLYLIHRDEIVFSDWTRRENKEKKIEEESEVKRYLPQNEDELRDQIVIPLLHKMGFKRIEARSSHGPGELGADILPFYKENEFGLREYYAAQIKTEKLRGGKEGGSEGNVIDVLRQCDSAMMAEWRDIKEGIPFRLDHFVLVALHGATQDAEKLLYEWPGRMETRRLIYITGIDLIDLVKRYESADPMDMFSKEPQSPSKSY